MLHMWEIVLVLKNIGIIDLWVLCNEHEEMTNMDQVDWSLSLLHITEQGGGVIIFR